MNVLRELVLTGRVCSAAELRRRYWALARRLHPDSAGTEAEGERFIRLRSDYEEALASLPPGRESPAAPGPRPTRREIMELFVDLAASGFPLDAGIRGSSRLYLRRIEEISALFRAAAIPGIESFGRVEEELYLVRGDNIIDNPLFGQVRMLFYAVVSMHYEPRASTRRAAEKWLGEMEGELRARGLASLLAFLEWIARGESGVDTGGRAAP